MSKKYTPEQLKVLGSKDITTLNDDDFRALFKIMTEKQLREGRAKVLAELKTYNDDRVKQEKKRKKYWVLKRMLKLCTEEMNSRPLDSLMAEMFPIRLRNE
tara:strand:- start:438 stop:740 length:303 start_codon:yes stop_codon:yes gene_type:complete